MEVNWDEKTEREVWISKGISQKDRSAHFYVVGATRMGKTRFLEYLIQQDIVQRKGFGIIDPHGDLFEDIKGCLYICYSQMPGKSLEDDVVIIDPTDPEKTAVFNPLERIEGAGSGKLASQLTMAFQKIWANFWGPRMENILRTSLIALSEADLTLAEIPLLLTNKVFRKRVLEKVKDTDCRDYFETDYESLTFKTKREWIESTLNKVRAFLSREEARHILSARKSSFNLREIIDGQKVLLVNLDKGQLGDTSDLLGSLLMAKIQMAAFSRRDLLPEERTPFYLYIDEFQNFASESFTETLAEAAKYGLSLVIAHQNLAQLPQELRASILGNCGIQIYFRVGRKDADILAKEGFRTTGLAIKDMKIGDKTVTPIYFSYPEEWENYIKGLQDLSPRWFWAIQKITGEALELYVPDVEEPWKLVEMSPKEFRKKVAEAGIGKKYLRKRKDIEKEYQKRRAKLSAVSEPKDFREKTPRQEKKDQKQKNFQKP